MRKYLLKYPSYVTSLLLFFAASCNGQNKIQLKEVVNTSKTTTAGTLSIIKTQGTNQYAAVSCGLQDKSGNLWFGTGGEGVYRYDGKFFTNYTTKDGLSSNTICSILEDKTGNIWFGSDAGISRYDGKTITIIPISMNNASYFQLNNNQNTRNTPSSMLQDKNGKIWVGTSKGVYCYNGSYFTHFLDNDNVVNTNGLHLNMVQSMLEDKNGNIWFTTWFEGVCRYDGKSVTNFKPNGEVWFAGLLEDKNGNIWVGRRSKGTCLYNGKTFTNVLQNGIFDSCCVTSIAEDKMGNIWFGTEAEDMTRRETMGGVWRYDGKTFTNFTTKDGLSNYSVFSIVKDRSGNIWFGTRNTGLCRYDGKSFTNFSAKTSK
jgi:ligand-binding sensor domain-containing protein